MGGKQLSFADALSDPRLGANRRLEAIGRAHFGYRLHAGVDEGSGLIRRLVLTPRAPPRAAGRTARRAAAAEAPSTSPAARRAGDRFGRGAAAPTIPRAAPSRSPRRSPRAAGSPQGADRSTHPQR